MSGDRGDLVPGGALQGPVFASLLERLSRAPKELPPGATIGPYRVVEPLGRGGMAVVYLAERADGEFEQKVALKIIPSDRESNTSRELLRRERQILAALNHPHIARLLDGGTAPDGSLWFAMELVVGVRIDRFVEQRKLIFEKRLELFLQVCDAVRFAHARLLIHRDLKPSNILVTEEGRVKLLDFGIAIAAGAQEKPAAALTPAFASPEQRRNEVITTASDIWQLGKLLEVLIGEPRDRDLRAIIDCAKNEELEARYAGVAPFAADVENLLAKRPVAARRGGTIYRAERFVARNRWSSLVIALLIAGACLAAIQFTYRLARERDRVIKEAERANAARSFVVELFRNADLGARGSGSIDTRQFLAAGVERIRADLDEQPALRAEMLQTIGRIHVALGEPILARPLYDEAMLTLRAHDRDPFALAEALRDQGAAMLESSNPLAALPVLRESRALLEENPPRLSSTLSLLSMAELGAGYVEEALVTQRRAVELTDQEFGRDSIQAAQSRQNLAVVLVEVGALEERMSAASEALRIYRAIYGPLRLETLRAQLLYATALMENRRPAEARPLFEEAAHALRLLHLGRGSIYASAIRSLGGLSAIEGDHRRAVEYFLETEELFRASIDADSLAMSWTLSNLGESYEMLGEYDLALDVHERALEIRRRRSSPDHFMLARALDASSRQWSRLGFGARAELLSLESLEIRSVRLGASSPHLANSLLPLGAAYWVLGEHDDARAAWDRALELLEGDRARTDEALRYISSRGR